jgi:predicted dehydrogenase
MSASVLAIVGGGRWGQLILSIVASMSVPFDRIVMVSKANASEVSAKVAILNLISRIPIEVLPEVDAVLAKYTVAAAVVVNAPSQHFATARYLIQRGISVLLEKPLVQTIEQMEILIAEANLHHAVLVPGLSYRFCSYLHNFADAVHHKGRPQQFQLRWSDARNEIRYGQLKRYDANITVVQDVWPHVWTILSVIFQFPIIKLLAGSQDQDAAVLTLAVNDIEGQVVLQRHADYRERYLALQFDADTLTLDFTREPGVMYRDAQEFSADPLWEQTPTPLTRQLEHFFAVMARGQSTAEDLLCCVGSVTCTELAAQLELPSQMAVATSLAGKGMAEGEY